MNFIRLALFFFGSTAWLLTLVWFVMWLAGAMTGFVPLYALLTSVALSLTFFGSFMIEPYKSKDKS